MFFLKIYDQLQEGNERKERQIKRIYSVLTRTVKKRFINIESIYYYRILLVFVIIYFIINYI